MAKEHTLSTVDGVEVGVPAAQRACCAQGRCRDFRQFGGEFLRAVDNHRSRNKNGYRKALLPITVIYAVKSPLNVLSRIDGSHGFHFGGGVGLEVLQGVNLALKIVKVIDHAAFPFN